MKKKYGLLVLVVALSISAYAQTVKGYVYADNNRNGKKDKTEKGIAGVGVSNGVQVVNTNNDGAYELPVGDDNIIFVIKPAGYSVALNASNQPQYYYIHKPNGSPSNFKYKGVEPTGKLPKSVDFALLPAQESDKFTSLIFGDPQPYTQQEVDFFAKGIVSEVAGIKDVAFGLSLGDLVGDDLNLHNPYISAVKNVGIPWYNLMGNHDMNYEATVDSLADETYEANFGPANYSFNYGKVHFIILDDIIYPDPRDGKGYWGGLRKDQLVFIENDLKLVPKENLVVLAFHIPLQMYNDAFRKEDRDRLFALLKDFPNTLSLSAHTHLQRNDFYTRADGWMQDKPHHEYNAGTTSGDWYSGELNEQGVPASTMRDGTPKGYAFIRFDGNKYVIDYKVAGKPADYQINVYAPEVMSSKRYSSYKFYANFFMGKKGDKVEFSIDGSKWKAMDYLKNADPSYLNLAMKWDFISNLIPGRRPSNPEESTHLWWAGFPGKLKAGEHTLEIRAVDMYGRTFTQKKTFRVQDPIELK